MKIVNDKFCPWINDLQPRPNTNNINKKKFVTGLL